MTSHLFAVGTSGVFDGQLPFVEVLGVSENLSCAYEGELKAPRFVE